MFINRTEEHNFLNQFISSQIASTGRAAMNEGEIEDILTHSFFQDELRLAYSMQPLDRLTAVLDQDDVHTLRELLEQGTVVPCYAWPSGRTLVHQAAALDAVCILSLLTEEHGLDVDIKQAGRSGCSQTPLYYAVMENRTRAVDWLIQHGANANSLTANDDSAIMVATMCSHERLVERLLELKLNPSKASRDGDFPLWRAASSGGEDIMRLLLRHGADVNQVMPVNSVDHCTYQRRGGPVLHILTATDKVHLAEMVLSRGADVNAPDGTGRTPLFNAVIRRNDKLVDLLLKAGCDVNLSGPILVAVALNRIDIVERLLANGANINLCHSQCGDCYSPLTKALCSGSEESVEFLLKKGADPNLECCEYSEKLPLYFAIQYPFQQRGAQLVKTLLEHGASIFVADKYFGTPLFMSAYLGHQEVVTLLIQEGADLFIQEQFGDSQETPLGIAVQCHQLQTAELLSRVVLYYGKEAWLPEAFKGSRVNFAPPWNSPHTEHRNGNFRESLLVRTRNPPLLKTICRHSIRRQIGKAWKFTLVKVHQNGNRGSPNNSNNSYRNVSNERDAPRLQFASHSHCYLPGGDTPLRHCHPLSNRDVKAAELPSNERQARDSDKRYCPDRKKQRFSTLLAQLPLPTFLIDFLTFSELTRN